MKIFFFLFVLSFSSLGFAQEPVSMEQRMKRAAVCPECERVAELKRDANALNGVLPNCGKSIQNIHWEKFKSEIQQQWAPLKKLGYGKDGRGLLLKNGKILQLGYSAATPEEKKAMALIWREFDVTNQLAQDLVATKKVQGDRAAWQRSLTLSRLTDAVLCPGSGFGAIYCGKDDQIQCGARFLVIFEQARTGLMKQIPGGCGKAIRASVTAPGYVEFEFEPAAQPSMLYMPTATGGGIAD